MALPRPRCEERGRAAYVLLARQESGSRHSKKMSGRSKSAAKMSLELLVLDGLKGNPAKIVLLARRSPAFSAGCVTTLTQYPGSVKGCTFWGPPSHEAPVGHAMHAKPSCPSGLQNFSSVGIQVPRHCLNNDHLKISTGWETNLPHSQSVLDRPSAPRFLCVFCGHWMHESLPVLGWKKFPKRSLQGIQEVGLHRHAPVSRQLGQASTANHLHSNRQEKVDSPLFGIARRHLGTSPHFSRARQ